MTTWLWIIVLWAVSTVVTMLIAGAVFVTLPADYLRGGDAPSRHWTARIIRSAVGVVLVGIGALLSLPGIPGQGVLTILAGLMLIEFPGRRRIVRAIIGRPAALAAINRLRAWFRRPPLTM